MADNQQSLSSDQQVRLMIWTVPRSTSSVLAKCLSFVECTKAFFETYACAFYHGPDRAEVHHTNAKIEERAVAATKEALEVTGITAGIDESQCSIKWVKEQLEEVHAGKRFIFCKDMAYTVTDRLEFLPKGYRHLFLIRHPMKVFPSWKKLFHSALRVQCTLDEFNMDDLPTAYMPKGFGFQEISQLLDHVKEVHDQEAIVIDADDLLEDPKGILSALFNAIGLPFEEKILQWEAGDAITQQWVISKQFLQANQLAYYYKNALDSTCFLKPRPLPDRSSLSPDIHRYVDASMPYYEKMYTGRLTGQ